MWTLLFTAAQVLYLLLPLLVAAAWSAVVLRYELWLPLKRPIDGGLTFRGKRLFGESKTWRGVVVAVAGAVPTALLQRYVLVDLVGSLAVFDYRSVNPVLFGALMAVGAMAGELPNSFVKRQVGIAPGKTTTGPLSVLFYVWDQVDLLTGAWPLVGWWVRPTAGFVAASFAVALVIHPTVSVIGYLLGARKTAR